LAVGDCPIRCVEVVGILQIEILDRRRAYINVGLTDNAKIGVITLLDIDGVAGLQGDVLVRGERREQ